MSPTPFNDDEPGEDIEPAEELMPGMRIIEGDEDLAIEDEKPKSALDELEDAEVALDAVPLTFEDESEEE